MTATCVIARSYKVYKISNVRLVEAERALPAAYHIIRY